MYLIGGFTPGKSILWHAGGSSVSIAGIQLSRHDSASRIYVTVGSDEKIKFCEDQLGVTAGYNYRAQDWCEEILKATQGRGVDIIIDFVGQNYFQANLNAAARDGRIVALGAMSGTKLPAGVDIGPFIMKRLRYEGSTLRSRNLEYQKLLRDKLAEMVLPGIRDGTYQVFIERVFDWKEVVEAHKLMESNSTRGKIICMVS